MTDGSVRDTIAPLITGDLLRNLCREACEADIDDGGNISGVGK
jgi:hypothetical protein